MEKYGVSLICEDTVNTRLPCLKYTWNDAKTFIIEKHSIEYWFDWVTRVRWKNYGKPMTFCDYKSALSSFKYMEHYDKDVIELYFYWLVIGCKDIYEEHSLYIYKKKDLIKKAVDKCKYLLVDVKKYEDVLKHLDKIDRRDLLCRIGDPEDIEVSAEECVRLLLEQFPVKRISKKVYKPNPNPYL